MQVSEIWLREWVDPPVSTQQLADTLTMAGLEVDSTGPAAAVFSGVVVARIAELAAHPDTGKLHVCSMDDGSGQRTTVVCDAGNVRAGLVTALAKVGAQLPGSPRSRQKHCAEWNHRECYVPGLNWGWRNRPRGLWNCLKRVSWVPMCMSI